MIGALVSTSYFYEGDTEMITLMEHLFLETGEVVHDESLLSGVNQIDAVGDAYQR